MVTFLTIAFGSAVGLGLLIAFLMWALISGFRSAVWLVIIFTIASILNGFNPGLKLGIHIYLGDLVFFAVGACAVVRFLAGRASLRSQWLWIAFGALLMISFIRGAATIGVSTAGNDLREFYYFFATTLYFASFRYDSKDVSSVYAAWSVFAILIMGVVLLRWAIDATGIDVGIDPRLWAGLANFGVSELRVVTSSAAMIIGIASVMFAFAFFRREAASPLSGLMFVATLVFVIVLQHRSVWVSTAAGLGVVLLLQQKNRVRSFTQLAIAGTLVVAVALPLAVSGRLERVTSDLGASFAEASRSHGSTLTWRLQGAAELTKDLFASGPVAIVMGKPMGSGYDRVVEDTQQEVQVSPHNFYVQLMLRIGLSGLAFFLLIYAGVVRDLLLQYKSGIWVTDPRPLIALVAVQLTYFLPYAGTPPMAIFLGMALSINAAARDAQPERLAASPRGAFA